MNATLKSLIGLSLLPVLVPFVGLLSLSRSYESRQFVRHFWRATWNDVRQLWRSREVAADVFTLCLLVILGLAGLAHSLGGQWTWAITDWAAAIWLATRE